MSDRVNLTAILATAVVMPRPACYSHMSPDEWAGSCRQMIHDLWRLADEDGCVGAAWALSMIEAAGKTVPRTVADRLESRVATLEQCLAFFASVIKSGEPWSETCEAEYRKAVKP